MHYSAFGRVDEITHEGANVYENYRYEFDVYGNKIGTENVTNYVYNINNQLLSETDAFTSKSYTYDRRGNLLDMKSKDEVLKTFTFDATNRMTASMGIVDGIQKNATYAYNGLGHRMEKNIYTGILPENAEKKIQYTIDMTRQYYNLLQTNSGEDNAQTYYWDGNVTGMESYGEESFYLQDDLGSLMQLLNADGMSCETFAYDEFGLGLVDQPRNRQMFGFTGYQMDEVGGLYFAQARRYDAQSGRFVSEDKVRGFIIVPYTLNHYNYCWNDPEDYIDKNGLWLTIVIGAAVGGVVSGLIEVGTQVYDNVKNSDSISDAFGNVDLRKVALETGKGLLKGAVAGTGLGLAASAGSVGALIGVSAIEGAIDAGGKAIEMTAIDQKPIDIGEVITEGIVSTATSFLGGVATTKITNAIRKGIGLDVSLNNVDDTYDELNKRLKKQLAAAGKSRSTRKYHKNRVAKATDDYHKTIGIYTVGELFRGAGIKIEDRALHIEEAKDGIVHDLGEVLNDKLICPNVA